MRNLAAVAIASILFAGVASAQMKVQQTTARPGTQAAVQSAQLQQAAEASLESAKRIPRDEAIKLVKENKAVFVDVRSTESYDAGHIKGAVSIPLSDLLARLNELPPHKFIITYCAWVQEHTSARAVLDLNAHGIKNTAALLGGWTGWVAAKEPIESGPPKNQQK